MTKQVALRLPVELVDRVDALVEDGRYSSRTDVVRFALQRLLDDLREAQLDAAIVAGYRRMPDAMPDAWLEEATRAVVAEEPW